MKLNEINNALKGATLTCRVHDDITGREHEKTAQVIEEVTSIKEGDWVCWVKFKGKDKPTLRDIEIIEALARDGQCTTHRSNDDDRRLQRYLREYPLPPRESYTLYWKATKQGGLSYVH